MSFFNRLLSNARNFFDGGDDKKQQQRPTSVYAGQRQTVVQQAVQQRQASQPMRPGPSRPMVQLPTPRQTVDFTNQKLVQPVLNDAAAATNIVVTPVAQAQALARKQMAKATGNKAAEANAYRDFEALKTVFSPGGGFRGAGTGGVYKSYDQATNLDGNFVEDYVKPQVRADAKFGQYALPGASKAVSIPARIAADAALNAGFTAGASAAKQQLDEGKVNAKQVAKDAVVAGVVGGVTRGGGEALRAGGKTYAKGVNKMADYYDSLPPAGTNEGGFIAGGRAKGYSKAEADGLVFTGKDGKKRFEGDDSKAVVRPIENWGDKVKTGVSLESVLRHDELFAQYPDLKNVKVKVTADQGSRYDPTTDTISLSAFHNKTWINDVLHETQHAIQKREGFEQGGSPSTLADKDVAAYEALPGEVEARRVVDRAAMSPQERVDSPVSPLRKAIQERKSKLLPKTTPLRAAIRERTNVAPEATSPGPARTDTASPTGQALGQAESKVPEPTRAKPSEPVSRGSRVAPSPTKSAKTLKSVESDNLPSKNSTTKSKTVNNNTTKTTSVKLNTKRLDVNPKTAARIDKATAAEIKRLPNKEVQRIAKSAGLDTKSYTTEETRQQIAKQLNIRRSAVMYYKAAEKARKTGDSKKAAQLIEQGADMARVSREQGTDLGRQLQARRIIADELDTPQARMFKLLDNAGVNPRVYSERFATVDFNNAKEVVKAYRELVPANATEWIDQFRYANMLSSPMTHIRNITGNLQGALLVRPLQKAFEGGVDATRAAITGGPRTRYASEAGSYAKGAVQSFGAAKQAFADSWAGKTLTDVPDRGTLANAPLATEGVKKYVGDTLNFISRVMEATDQFGIELIKGGERASLKTRVGKGTAVKDIEASAQEAADYALFREQLGSSTQGHVSNAIDYIPREISKARSSTNPVIKWASRLIFPFVKTPANISKQMVEFSPLGFSNLYGAADKTAVVAKATMGTVATATVAGTFAATGNLTGAKPSDSDEKKAWAAEKKQPYSVKVGNHWLSYKFLHPGIAFPLAATAAVNDALRNDKIDDSTADRILTGMGSVSTFFVNQSYFKNVQDFLNNVQGEGTIGSNAKSLIAGQAANVGTQFVPFRAALSWMNNFIDQQVRYPDNKADALTQFKQTFESQLPGLSKNVPAYTDINGVEVKKNHPVINNFSPLTVATQKGTDAEIAKTASVAEKIVKIKQDDKKRDEQFAQKFSRDDLAIAKLKKDDQEKLVADGTITQEKLDGLRGYYKDQRVKAGYEKASTSKVNPNLGKSDKDIIANYDKLDRAAKRKYSKSANDADYKLQRARHNNKLAEGGYDDEDSQIRAEAALKRAEVGSKYSSDVRSIYGLSKPQQANYLNGLPKDKADQFYGDLQAYDNALVDSGINKYRKFKNGLQAASRGSGGGTTGSRRSGGRSGGSGRSRASGGTAKAAKLPGGGKGFDSVKAFGSFAKLMANSSKKADKKLTRIKK